jgi:putative heme-binding domain-containing protein
MKKPGELALKARLERSNLLRPAVQPGSRLDAELPPEWATVWFESPDNLLNWGSVGIRDRVAIAPKYPRTDPGQLFAVDFSIIANGKPKVSVTFSTDEDHRPRALPLHRILVTWAIARPEALEEPAALVRAPQLDGGSWARGRQVFFSEEAACAKCHAVHGQGGTIGPDLSNLIHRDYESVLRDITQPSFAINPDYLTYLVNLKDGRVLTGVVRTDGDRLHVGDQKGTDTVIDRSAVEAMTPSPVSTMPEGMPKLLGPERLRDLLTFLLTEPPSMPRDHPGPRPKPRTEAEVKAVLAGAPEPPQKTRPLRVVLVAGPKDHGKGEHDYPAWQKAWKELFATADKVEVVTAWEWPAKEEFTKADVMVFYQHGDWTPQRAADIDLFLERGGGLVYVHWAVDGREDAPGFAKRIGLASRGGRIKYRHGPLELSFNKAANHPITRNLDTLKLVDESYWELTGELPPERVLATGVEENQPRPLFWALEHGRGRVFVSIPGHFSWTFDDPLFRVVLLRGIAWAAREPVDRFNDLVWPGADVAK